MNYKKLKRIKKLLFYNLISSISIKKWYLNFIISYIFKNLKKLLFRFNFLIFLILYMINIF